MKFISELLMLIFLVHVFRKVREWRINKSIDDVLQKNAKIEAIRVDRAARNWTKINTRDVRDRRMKHVDDAPSYTSYAETTGRYKKL